jgi:hypothetical protein
LFSNPAECFDAFNYVAPSEDYAYHTKKGEHARALRKMLFRLT